MIDFTSFRVVRPSVAFAFVLVASMIACEGAPSNDVVAGGHESAIEVGPPSCNREGGTCARVTTQGKGSWEEACGQDLIPKSEKQGASCKGDAQFVCCVPPTTTSCVRNGGVCARLSGGDWAASCPNGHVPDKSGGEPCNGLKDYVCCVPEAKTECGLAGGVCSPYAGGDWYTACAQDQIPRGSDDRIEDKGASCNGDPKLVCCVPRTTTACESQGGTCRLHGGADPADACGLDEIPNGGGWGAGCNGDAAFVCCVKL